MRYVKFGCLTLLAIPILWLFVIPWVGSKWTRTVATGEKHYPYGANTNWGFSVEEYRWRNGFRVNIWAGDRLAIRFDEPWLELVRVKTQRWLIDDRALVLEVDYIYHDSIDSPGEVGWFFDFETGELRSYGQGHAWPPDQRDARRATKEEFHRFVESMEGR